jgi:hypothetical protein
VYLACREGETGAGSGTPEAQGQLAGVGRKGTSEQALDGKDGQKHERGSPMYQMNAFLDAAVQLIQVAILLIVVAQNFGLSKRLKAIEEKQNR